MDFDSLCQWPARRAAPGAQGHSRRRNARPRHGENRLERGGNRPPGLEHAAHHQRRRNHQPHPRHVRSRRSRSKSASGWRIRCAGSSASAWRRKLAAAATRCSKSWGTTSAPRKPSGSAKAKARPFTKSSRRTTPSAGATSTTPASRPIEQGIITEETALLYCTKRGVVSRAIDNIKKERGEITSDVGSLKMKPMPLKSGRRPPPRSYSNNHVCQL